MTYVNYLAQCHRLDRYWLLLFLYHVVGSQNNWILDLSICFMNLEESLHLLRAELGADKSLFPEGEMGSLKKGVGWG